MEGDSTLQRAPAAPAPLCALRVSHSLKPAVRFPSPQGTGTDRETSEGTGQGRGKLGSPALAVQAHRPSAMCLVRLRAETRRRASC